MTLQELMTLVQDDIPVKIALFDNKKLGMIRQWQEIIYAGNYHSAHLLGPDYLKLAEAYGIPAVKASTPAEVDDAIRFAQAAEGPALVWFEIAGEQNVFPMMPAGKGLSDLIETWGGGGRIGRSTATPPAAGTVDAGPHRAAPSAARRRPGAAPPPRGHRRRQARRPEPGVEPDARAELQHRLAGRRAGPIATGYRG